MALNKEMFLDYAYVKYNGKYQKLFEDHPWIDDIFVIMRGMKEHGYEVEYWCEQNCNGKWLMLKDEGFRSFWAFEDLRERELFEQRWHTKERDWIDTDRENYPYSVMFTDPPFTERGEVYDWLQDNCQGLYYVFGEALMVCWNFTNEQDAILFKLTWSG